MDLIPDNNHEGVKSIGIFLMVFCATAFVVLIPLLVVQTVNVVTKTTTHDRFARQTRSPDSYRNSSQMFIEGEEQIFSILTGNTAPSTLIQETTTSCFCCTRKIEVVNPSGWEEMRQTLRESES